MRVSTPVILLLLLSGVQVAAAGPEAYAFDRAFGEYDLSSATFGHGGTSIAVDPGHYVYVVDWDSMSIKQYTEAGTFVRQFGSVPANGLIFDIAVGPTGDVYQSWISYSPRAAEIRQYTSAGTLVRTFGSYGQGNGQFNWPACVGVDGAGYVYVLDRGTGLERDDEVQKFTANGAFVSRFPLTAGGDSGLEIDASGNIYTFDTNRQAVIKYSASGTFLTRWECTGTGEPPFGGTFGIGKDADGGILVGEVYGEDYNYMGRIWKFRPDGTFVMLFNIPLTGASAYTTPMDVAANTAGDLFVAAVNYDYATFEGEIQKYSRLYDARFSANPASGPSPHTVRFTDESTWSPNGWLWDFGDGQQSSAASPSHAYANPGTYTVKLNVSYAARGGISRGVVRTNLVTVHGSLSPNFDVSARTGYEPLTVRFTDLTTGVPTSWHWDFGDGGTSDLQNPTHTFQGALSGDAFYTVTLTVSNGYDTKTATKTDVIRVIPLYSGRIMIEAEDYIDGGEGVAYHDTDTSNSGRVYRSDGVDIIASGSGYAIWDVYWGEWTKYWVWSPAATQHTYPLTLRLANQVTGRTIGVSVDGIAQSTDLTVPNTGSLSTYTDVPATITLNPGENLVRVAYDGQLNFDYFTLDLAAALPTNPDLAVSHALPPAATVANRTISVPNAVKNFGAPTPRGFSIGFYLSADRTITTADTLVGTRYVASLPARAETSETTGMTIPATVPGGNYYFGIIADYLNQIPEPDRANNAWCAAIPFTLASSPDLRSGGLYPGPGGPASPIVNRTFTLQNAVLNAGVAPAGPFTVGFYLSSDNRFTTSDTLIGTRNLSGLAPGVTAPSMNTPVTIPASVPAGTFYIGMIVDSTNAVTEGDETNNIGGMMPGQHTLAASPDLKPDAFQAPPDPITNRTFTIRNGVRNVGDASSVASTVEFYLSTDSAITTADTLIGTRAIPALPAGMPELWPRTPMTIPDSVQSGSYYLGMIVDPANAVTEGNELNNVAMSPGPITLALSPAVLAVPPGGALPTDTDGDGKYDDVNGNGRKDFADVVLFFNQMSWIAGTEPLSAFDYNGNGRIDFADVVWLFNHL